MNEYAALSKEPLLSSRHCGRGFCAHSFYLHNSLRNSIRKGRLSSCFQKRRPRLREVEWLVHITQPARDRDRIQCWSWKTPLHHGAPLIERPCKHKAPRRMPLPLGWPCHMKPCPFLHRSSVSPLFTHLIFNLAHLVAPGLACSFLPLYLCSGSPLAPGMPLMPSQIRIPWICFLRALRQNVTQTSPSLGSFSWLYPSQSDWIPLLCSLQELTT